MKWTSYTCVPMCALAGLTLFAQDGSKLQSFRQEFAFPSTGVVPPELTEAVESGNIQIRQQIRYDGPGNHLDVLTFPVMTGAPALTPNEALPCTPLEEFRVDLTSVSVSGNLISFSGTVAPGAKSFLSSVTDGDKYELSSAFALDGAGNAAIFRDISIVAEDARKVSTAAGMVVVSSTVPQPPVIVATTDFITTQPETQIDASGSMDPDSSLPLEFYWRSTQGAAAIRGCRTANPTVQFASGPGGYQFLVSVTDAAGASKEATVTITYYGR